MSVAVVMVTHNHGPTIAATLRAVAAQTRPPEQVVVIDNASADDSLNLARAFAASLPLEVVAWRENRGFAAAFNEGVRRSAAPWVLSLNPDCRLAPDFLAVLTGRAAVDPRAGAACGLLLRARGAELAETDTVDSAGMVMTPAGRHLDRGAGGRLTPELTRPARVFGASGAAALYRRQALEDVAYSGGEVMDEGFFAYREDADLAWRLQRRGWECLYLPRALGYHARGLKPEARRRGSAEINRHSVRNRFLLRWSNADWRWHLVCFPAWLIRDVLVVGACLTVERPSLPGMVEAWRRRQLQRRRGEANHRRARISSWRLASWFYPWGRVRPLEE
ncbi:MAG: glycosyltransferase family 2 protein [Acidobacteriota bacterium]|jgi:GT2 family glycosyltransferase